jgi:hypothetical protein
MVKASREHKKISAISSKRQLLSLALLRIEMLHHQGLKNPENDPVGVLALKPCTAGQTPWIRQPHPLVKHQKMRSFTQ